MLCKECGGTNFSEHFGFYYCDRCNTMHTDSIATMVEDDADFDENGQASAQPRGRYINVYKGNRLSWMTYEEAIQRVLRAQVEVLINDFGFPAEFLDVVGKIWFHFLASPYISSYRSGSARHLKTSLRKKANFELDKMYQTEFDDWNANGLGSQDEDSTSTSDSSRMSGDTSDEEFGINRHDGDDLSEEGNSSDYGDNSEDPSTESDSLVYKSDPGEETSEEQEDPQAEEKIVVETKKSRSSDKKRKRETKPNPEEVEPPTKKRKTRSHVNTTDAQKDSSPVVINLDSSDEENSSSVISNNNNHSDNEDTSPPLEVIELDPDSSEESSSNPKSKKEVIPPTPPKIVKKRGRPKREHKIKKSSRNKKAESSKKKSRKREPESDPKSNTVPKPRITEPKKERGVRLTNIKRQSNTMSVTLNIILIACWYMRLPVLPLDISRWCRSGRLPFFGIDNFLPQTMAEKHTIVPYLVSRSKRLLKSTVTLLKELKFEKPCPPINDAPILSRFCTLLDLPPIIEGATLRLLRMNPKWDGSLVMPTSPYNLLLGHIVIVLKLLYKFDDTPVTSMEAVKNESIGPKTLESWIKTQEQRLSNLKLDVPWTFEELKRMPSNGLDSFIDFCKDKVLGRVSNRFASYLDFFHRGHVNSNLVGINSIQTPLSFEQPDLDEIDQRRTSRNGDYYYLIYKESNLGKFHSTYDLLLHIIATTVESNTKDLHDAVASLEKIFFAPKLSDHPEKKYFTH